MLVLEEIKRSIEVNGIPQSFGNGRLSPELVWSSNSMHGDFVHALFFDQESRKVELYVHHKFDNQILAGTGKIACTLLELQTIAQVFYENYGPQNQE